MSSIASRRAARRRGTAAGAGLTDAELLERYVRGRDEAAFELLLWRHGVLVFNVCRRLLPREQDAEDAFQATFLILARQAARIVHAQALGGWLYEVAFRTANRARKAAVLRHAHSNFDHREDDVLGFTLQRELAPRTALLGDFDFRRPQSGLRAGSHPDATPAVAPSPTLTREREREGPQTGG